MLSFIVSVPGLSLSSRLILWVLAWSIVACLGVGGAFVLARLVKTAAARSLVWTSCLGFLVAGPLVELVCPKALTVRLPRSAETLPNPSPFIPTIPSLPTDGGSLPEDLTGALATIEEIGVGTGVLGAGAIPRGALAVVLAGVAVCLVVLALGWIRMRRYRARACEDSDGRAQAAVDGIASSMGLRGSVLVLVTSDITVPATFGAARPVLLLPSGGLETLLEPAFRGVLAHELGHVIRGDYLRNLVGYLACAMYWFAPPVWLAFRTLRREMELACDDIAILATDDSRGFAQALGWLALVSANTCPAAGGSLFLFRRRRAILARMSAAVGPTRRAWRPQSMLKTGLAVSLSVIAGAVALAGFGRDGLGGEGALLPALLRQDGFGGSGLADRQVRFPDRYAIGTIAYRLPGRTQWIDLVSARGTVELPSDRDYRLILNASVLAHPSSLGCIAGSRISAVSSAGLPLKGAHLLPLAQCRGVQVLDLSGAPLGVGAVGLLCRMTWLRTVILTGTGITDRDIERVRAALPGCAIVVGGRSASALRAESDAQRISWPKAWHAFGPFPERVSLPDSLLRRVPQSLPYEKTNFRPVVVGSDGNEWIDLESVFGARKEWKTALLFAELSVPHDMDLTIWAAADWWMSWHIDGVPVYDTHGAGNQSTDYVHPNHSFTVRLRQGRHVIAVQVASGSKGWGLTSAAVAGQTPVS